MQQEIKSVSRESRSFPPSAAFAAGAHVPSLERYQELYRQSIEQPEAFWREQCKLIDWFKFPTRAQSGELPEVTWFEDGTTNVSLNCLDRHQHDGRRHKAALVFEGEPGDTRVLSYQDLWRETCRLANALEQLGLKSGDRVAIYMGMVPEAAIAMLACTRIGAVHSVIFGGFAADAIRDRVNDAGASLIITQDGAYRRGQIVPLKDNVDKALADCPGVQHTLVLRRCNNAIFMQEGRDLDYHTLVAAQSDRHEARELPAEHPLFILYTSGSTGKPKGVLHTTAGYLLWANLTFETVFDYRAGELFWCTADVGWVTGHS
ncbi:MAG: hypothetical protein RL033_4260, partial [Pseudomonadota bacterium]